MSLLSEEEKMALWHLACRTNKIEISKYNRPNWARYDWMEFSSAQEELRCLICQNLVVKTSTTDLEYFEKIYDHGIMHLKEHNLLVFI